MTPSCPNDDEMDDNDEMRDDDDDEAVDSDEEEGPNEALQRFREAQANVSRRFGGPDPAARC